MKKVLFALAIGVASIASAQTTKIDAGVGIPTGDAGDLFSFNIYGGVRHYFLEPLDGLQVGGYAGLDYNFGKTYKSPISIPGFPTPSVDIKDAIFLPVAASAQYKFNDAFGVSLDLGYAFNLSGDDYAEGGFYFAPKAFYGITENIDLTAGYKKIDELNSFTFGASFGF